MPGRGAQDAPRPQPRRDCYPEGVVPEGFTAGVHATKLLVEEGPAEGPSAAQLQRLAERTLESLPETKGVTRRLEFYLWYSPTVHALFLFRALQVLDYLIHCGPRHFESWARGNVDRLQALGMGGTRGGLWGRVGSYAEDLVRVLSEPDLLMVERSWSELWVGRVEATVPLDLQRRGVEARTWMDDVGEEELEEQLPPYPGHRAPEDPTKKLVHSSSRGELGSGRGARGNDNPTIPEHLLGPRVSSRKAL